MDKVCRELVPGEVQGPAEQRPYNDDVGISPCE